MARFVMILLGLFLVSPAVGARSTAAEVRQVSRYCKQVDSYVREHPSAFVNLRRGSGVNNDGDGKWRRWPKARAAEAVDSNGDARLWRRDGKIVFVTFLLQSGSRDWALYVSNYYRLDGTLAKIESELRTFYGNVSVERDWLYRPDGSLISFKARCFKLPGREPAQLDDNFIDIPVPLYPTVAHLPFQSLLRQSAAPN